MIFEFHTPSINFFPEDRSYFEDKLTLATKFLGTETGDEDSIKCHTKIEKKDHHSGPRFEAKAHVTSPHGGDFVAEVSDQESIRACADLLEDKLGTQMKKFHEKRTS